MPFTLLFLLTLIWLPIMLVVAYDVLWDLRIWQASNYSLRRAAHGLRWDAALSHRDLTRTVFKFILGLGLGIYLVSPGSPVILVLLVLLYSLWVNDSISYAQRLLRNQVPYLRPHFRITLIYTLLTLIFAAAAVLTGSFMVYFATRIDYNFSPTQAMLSIPSWAYSMTILVFLVGLILDLGSPILTGTLVVLTKPEQWLVGQYFQYRAKQKLMSAKNLAVVLVAGSYGKTSVKNLLAQLAAPHFRTLYLREEESLLGIAKDITHKLRPDTQVFICDVNEMRPGELSRVIQLLQPQLTVLTGLDETYRGIYRTGEALIASYQHALERLPAGNAVIINGSDELLRTLAKRNNSKEVVYFPNSQSVDIEDNELETETVHISDLQVKPGSAIAYVLLKFQAHSLPLEIPSKYVQFLPSILPTLLALRELGIHEEEVVGNLPAALPLLTDLEEIAGDNNSTILYHPARSTIDNLEVSLAKLARYNGDKYLIIGGIGGLGKKRNQLYQELAETIHANVDVVITFDKALANALMQDNHSTDVALVENVDALIYAVTARLEPGDILLIHGVTDPLVLEALRSQS